MIIRHESQWPAVYRHLDTYREQLRPFPQRGVEVIWREAKAPRSLNQNALAHAWYAQVSAEEGQYTAEEVKHLCKLHFAIPILREDAEISEMMAKVLDPLPYADQVKAMRYLSATSLMSKAQMSRYLEQVQQHYAGRVRLEFPDEV